MNYILCSKDMSEIPENRCCNNCKICPFNPDRWIGDNKHEDTTQM